MRIDLKWSADDQSKNNIPVKFMGVLFFKVPEVQTSLLIQRIPDMGFFNVAQL
jgi:hypothetical protein